MIYNILFFCTINQIFFLLDSLAMSTSDFNFTSTEPISFQTSISDTSIADTTINTTETTQFSTVSSLITTFISEQPVTNLINSTLIQNETESLITTIFSTKELSTSQSVIPNITSTTASSFPTTTIENNTARVVGILVTFGCIGILIVLGFLFYVWRKTKLEENKYVTLADRLNTQSSRPPSPTTNMNEDLFVNNLGNETVFSNPAFNLQERPSKDDNFKFDFDDLTIDKRNNESNL